MKHYLPISAAMLAAALVSGHAQAGDRMGRVTTGERLTGVYVMVSGAYTSFDLDGSGTIGGTDFDIDGGSASGPAIAGHLGTSLMQGNFFGAIEIYGGVNSADFDLSLNGDRVEIDAEEFYGINVRAGRVFERFIVLYGLLGYQETKFELTASDGTGRTRDSETSGGIRGGVGVEFTAHDRVFARFEYSLTRYSSESFNNGSYRPTESQFLVGAGYRF